MWKCASEAYECYSSVKVRGVIIQGLDPNHKFDLRPVWHLLHELVIPIQIFGWSNSNFEPIPMADPILKEDKMPFAHHPYDSIFVYTKLFSVKNL